MNNYCQICNKHFTAEKVVDHWMSHVDQDVTTCPFCSEEFDDVRQFREHIILHKPTEKPFVCCHCDQKFIQYSELREHQMRREDEKRFLCVICYRAFYQCYHLKLHHMAHHKEEKFSLRDTLKDPFTDNINEKSILSMRVSELIPSKTDLEIHTNTLLQNNLHICSYCELVFGSYSDLSKHMLTHKNENSVACTLCRNLVLMEKVVHKRKGIFVCTSCSTNLMKSETSSTNEKEVHKYNIENISQLQKSEKKSKHHNNHSQSGSDRNISFKTSQSVQSKTEKLICSYCDQNFARETSLKRHVVHCRQEYWP